MLKKTEKKNQRSMFFSLGDTLDQSHPLYILGNKMNWKIFEEAFSKLYCKDNGRPGLPIRLMVGLLILKHLRNLSDESVVEQWSENNYYQYLCGQEEFLASSPCSSSELVHFRERIGDSGIELILGESIRINGKDSEDKDVSVDTTVQEKNITFPTDDKLHKKIIKRCRKIAAAEGLALRQSYTKTIKELSYAQRFRNHPKNKVKSRKADKKVKTIAGRLVRELERKLICNSSYQRDICLFKQVLEQRREDKEKLYSLHGPEVCCISKGKLDKKYEFGNKSSIVITQKTGVIVGAKSYRNEYDGHTLESSLAQARKLLGTESIKTATVDSGYRGMEEVIGIKIIRAKPFKKDLSNYRKQKIKGHLSRRAAIEPVIGHLKSDHRLGRNFYKGVIGDNMNIMLAAAAYNFKRMMRKWKSSFYQFLYRYFISPILSFFDNIFYQSNSMWVFKG